MGNDIESEMLALGCEVDHGTANLHGFVKVRDERRALLDQHESAELGLVVFKHELAVFQLDLRVAPGDRDVVDSKIAFMAST